MEDFSDASLLRKLKAFRGGEEEVGSDDDESDLFRENVESNNEGKAE